MFTLSKQQLTPLPIALSVLIMLLGMVACNYPGTGTPSTEPPSTPQVAPASPTPVAPTAASTDAPSQIATAEAPASDEPPSVLDLRIVYTDDGNLWIRDGMDPPRLLAASGSVSEGRISSDGSLIAYVERDPVADTAELRSIRADGSDDRLLLSSVEFDALYHLGEFLHYTLSQFAFVPDTYILLFNTRGVFEGLGVGNNDDLLIIDAETGDFGRLLAPGTGGEFTFSPDGSQVVIVRPESIGFVDSDGSNLRSEVLEFARVITYSEYFFYPHPVWAPDGESVLVIIPAEDPFASPRSGTIWKVHADGTTPSEQRVMSGDFFRPQGIAPLVAPDLARVAYFRDSADPAVIELVIADLMGDSVMVYDRGSIQWRGWSPSSDTFIYAKNGGMSLWLGEIDQPPRPLVEGRDPRWVSERVFLFVTGAPNDWSLKKSQLGADPELIVDPEGGSISYDFVAVGE